MNPTAHHPPGSPRPPYRRHEAGSCEGVPEFTRLRYFYGQMLGPADFTAEQDYFREKLKLHNRCLHGYGTVCGLGVVPIPPAPDCDPDDECAKLADELKDLKQADASPPQNEARAETDKRRARMEELRRRLEDYRVSGRPREDDDGPHVRIERGFALDCRGNELVVRNPMDVDLWCELSPADRDKVRKAERQRHDEKGGGAAAGTAAAGAGAAAPPTGQGGAVDVATTGGQPAADPKSQDKPDAGASRGVDLYVSICYCAEPVDPVRPVVPDACGAGNGCTHGKLRDGVRVRVTVDPPAADLRCDPCCDPCADGGDCSDDACLLLARVVGFRRDRIPAVAQVHNHVRRMADAATVPPTVITGINWVHGATYNYGDAKKLLGSDYELDQADEGLCIEFSRPILTETLNPGVIDLFWIKGGRGESGTVVHLAGEFVNATFNEPTTRQVRYQQLGDDNLSNGDRVLVIVRTDFILDECCRPVDGNHVGGRVPVLPDSAPAPVLSDGKPSVTSPPRPESCLGPPGRFGPWTSGNGTPGGTFESWFFIQASEQKKGGKQGLEGRPARGWQGQQAPRGGGQ